MERYIIQRSLEDEDIGNSDGFQCYSGYYPSRNKFFNTSLYSPYDEPVIDHIGVYDDAILTDLPKYNDGAFKGFLMSPKAYAVIKEFNLQDVQIIPAKLRFKGKIIDYFWLHCYMDLTPIIDYNKTQFQVTKVRFLDVTNEKLDPQLTKAEIIEIDRSIGGSSQHISTVYQYYFTEYIDNIDIIRIGHWDLNFYFSERLKITLEDNNVTAVDFVQSRNF